MDGWTSRFGHPFSISLIGHHVRSESRRSEEAIEFEMLNHVTDEEDLIAIEEIAARIAGRFEFSTAIEIGTWSGQSASVISDHVSELFCVDHWRGNLHDGLTLESAGLKNSRECFRAFCRNMGSKLHTRVYPCFGTGSLWASVWVKKANLIYIDAEHDYHSAKTDILEWLPLLSERSVIAGHDYNQRLFPGVIKAVDEIFGSRVKVTGKSVWSVEL